MGKREVRGGMSSAHTHTHTYTLAWQPAANTFERKRKFTQRQDVAELVVV